MIENIDTTCTMPQSSGDSATCCMQQVDIAQSFEYSSPGVAQDNDDSETCCMQQVQVDFLAILQSIANGRINYDIDILISMFRTISTVEKTTWQSQAVIAGKICLAYDKNTDGLKQWCDENLQNITGSNRSHLFSCGKMLIDLLNCSMPQYKKVFKQSQANLITLTSIHRLGTKVLINFINKYLEDKMNRDKLRKCKDQYLKMLAGNASESDLTHEPEQLSFQFNLFDELDESTVAKLMESENFDESSAMSLLDNALLICENTVPYVISHPDYFTSEDDLAGLEYLYSSLANSSNQILQLINAKKRELLSNGE